MSVMEKVSVEVKKNSELIELAMKNKGEFFIRLYEGEYSLLVDKKSTYNEKKGLFIVHLISEVENRSEIRVAQDLEKCELISRFFKKVRSERVRSTLTVR